MNAAALSVSLGLSILLMGSKFYAYRLTGSTAILSDALESIINVAAGIFALSSVLISARPPDEGHPYGHGKIEFFAAGFEGALIILAALGMFDQGLKQILNPRDLPDLQSGMLILFGAGAINLATGITLVRIGRRNRSLILVADGEHILTDVYTSASVIGGLLLVYASGWYRLDGIVACLMGLGILIVGARLVRRSFGGLMDASDPELLDRISALLARNRKDIWIDVHRLRAWPAGNRIHADFHLILPRDMPLEEGHREVKELEEIFSREFDGQAEVLIHLDPCMDPDCPVCWFDPCENRMGDMGRKMPWQRMTLTREEKHGPPSAEPGKQAGPSDPGPETGSNG